MPISKLFLNHCGFVCAGLVFQFALSPSLLRAQGTRAMPWTIPLPSSKGIMEPVSGSPQKTNSLPMKMAISPDGRYVALVNAGYGTYESKYEQSIAVLDRQTGRLLDFPNDHTPRRAKQTLYSGLAFSSDGRHLYVSIASLTDPIGALHGGSKDAVGNGIVVYGFAHGKVTEERILSIPLQPLSGGKQQNNMAKKPLPAGMANPYPSGLAVIPGTANGGGGDEILVADNLSDDALLIRATDGRILHRFDLSTSNTVPASYPIAAVATRYGTRGFVALWNASAIAELDLRSGRVLQILPLLPPHLPTDSSSHPAALLLNKNESVLYVALANRDSVAAIAIGQQKVRPGAAYRAMHLLGFFDTRLPGEIYFGAVPDALALSPDGSRLYVADASLDAIAIFNPHALAHTSAPIHALGFIPTEWYPTALAVTANHLYAATGKGQGTGPNNFPQKQVATGAARKYSATTYIPTLLYGSLAAIDLNTVDRHLPALSNQALESNRMRAAQDRIAFPGGKNPIRHVIYILKENRSYDQMFGDLKTGNNDPSLTMYGWAITPNEHKLAEQFGILDNFYVSGEVSGDGHVWSTAAITSDYTEKTWQQGYRGGQRVYDYEGMVAKGNPLVERIPDIDDPDSGYLWTNLARHHRTYYHFGEFVATTFCDDHSKPPRENTPRAGTPEPAPVSCAPAYIRKGDPIPPNYGGGVSLYPWKIPLIARDVATKPELVGHFDPPVSGFQSKRPGPVSRRRVSDPF